MDELRFRINDIVKISRKSKYYGCNTHNPKDINGKVIKTYVINRYSHYEISWDNKTNNFYSDLDLRLVRRSNG